MAAGPGPGLTSLPGFGKPPPAKGPPTGPPKGGKPRMTEHYMGELDFERVSEWAQHMQAGSTLPRQSFFREAARPTRAATVPRYHQASTVPMNTGAVYSVGTVCS